MNKTFGIIGGDQRQVELARLLREQGRQVCTYGLRVWQEETTLEAALSCEVVILPLPLCREDGILNCTGVTVTTEQVFQQLSPEQIVLAGQVRQAQMQEAASHGIVLRDYFRREELLVANAAITAEDAIQVAMEHLDRTMLGMECLVIGFGRVGKLLCHRLHGLGASVTVAARKPCDLAWVKAYGWKAVRSDALDGMLTGFHAVWNTAPSLVLEERRLAQLPRDCLCVDLASVPGVDLAAAQRLGLSCVWARGLPGKLSPITAAAAIRDAVDSILEE